MMVAIENVAIANAFDAAAYQIQHPTGRLLTFHSIPFFSFFLFLIFLVGS